MNNPVFCGKASITNTMTILLAGLLLGISPMSATAQDISWDPATMTFPDTPIGTTATQTLTITNEDEALPMNVSSIEWTYNQVGVNSGDPQYAFVAGRSVPAILLPGEELTIDILFTPEEAFTFASANLLVTNSSSNAASLNYWVDGMGIEGALCYPLVSCSGTCADLDSDVNNCGMCGNVCPMPDVGLPFCITGVCNRTCDVSIDLNTDPDHCGACDNVCEAPANGTSVCEDGSCSFVCDEGHEVLDDECIPSGASIVGLTNLLINYWFAALEEPATIVGFGPGESAVHRRDAIENMLLKAREYVFAGVYDSACGQLRTAYIKTDGGYPFVLPPDFVAGEGVSGLNERIVAVVEGLDGLMPDGCPLPEPTTKSR